ncbi:hypothetical protein F5888DRAFT_122292 [Russula emetica]|nr:hypothetical protein F5888DRAFT_122292 [Russula emetica]
MFPLLTMFLFVAVPSNEANEANEGWHCAEPTYKVSEWYKCIGHSISAPHRMFMAPRRLSLLRAAYFTCISRFGTIWTPWPR